MALLRLSGFDAREDFLGPGAAHCGGSPVIFVVVLVAVVDGGVFAGEGRGGGIERDAAAQSAGAGGSGRRPAVGVVGFGLAGAGGARGEVRGAAVLEEGAHVCDFAEPADLLPAGLVVAEFVADDGTRMGDQGFDHVFLELQGEVKVRPGLVAVFQRWHAEDEIVDVFDVAMAFAFVAEAQHHAWDLDKGQGHVVGCAVHHLRQVVSALLGFPLRFP